MISNLEGARLIGIASHVKTEFTIVRLTEHICFGLDRISAEKPINFSTVEAMTGSSIE